MGKPLEVRLYERCSEWAVINDMTNPTAGIRTCMNYKFDVDDSIDIHNLEKQSREWAEMEKVWNEIADWNGNDGKLSPPIFKCTSDVYKYGAFHYGSGAAELYLKCDNFCSNDDIYGTYVQPVCIEECVDINSTDISIDFEDLSVLARERDEMKKAWNEIVDWNGNDGEAVPLYALFGSAVHVYQNCDLFCDSIDTYIQQPLCMEHCIDSNHVDISIDVGDLAVSAREQKEMKRAWSEVEYYNDLWIARKSMINPFGEPYYYYCREKVQCSPYYEETYEEKC